LREAYLIPTVALPQPDYKLMSRIPLALILILVLPWWGVVPAARAGQSRPLVITHVNVIDVVRGIVRRDMSVVISDGRIVALGKAKSTRTPGDADVVDATGKFMIPGLWDMHAHLGKDHFDRDGHLKLFLVNGVTGIRIMDGDPAHHRWRTAINSGDLVGPRMSIASPIIGQVPISVNQAVASVRNAKLAGSDFAKVHEALSREAYFAVVAEARKLGLPVAGHVPTAMTPAEVSTLGQKSIEHFTGLDEAKTDRRKARRLAAVLVTNHTWFCPTLIMRQSYASLDDTGLARDPRLKYVKPSWVRRWLRLSADANKTPAADWVKRRELVGQEKALVGVLQRNRVGILAGTDEVSPFCSPGFSLHDELALLVESGLTPGQALQAATINPARFLDLTPELGTITRGKLADLVLLDQNPLTDIHNTTKIHAVVFNGRLFDRNMLDRMLSEIEKTMMNNER
jgi:imidazolonepropionase-like amidohydrolase